MHYLETDSVMMYILPVYGTSLVLLVVSAIFFFFMSKKVGCLPLSAGILFVFGAILFYISDSLIAHGKYTTPYIDLVNQALNSTLIMATYYVCQYLIASGAFAISDYQL